jgi:hypothetical protein
MQGKLHIALLSRSLWYRQLDRASTFLHETSDYIQTQKKKDKLTSHFPTSVSSSVNCIKQLSLCACCAKPPSTDILPGCQLLNTGRRSEGVIGKLDYPFSKGSSFICVEPQVTRIFFANDWVIGEGFGEDSVDNSLGPKISNFIKADLGLETCHEAKGLRTHQ